VVIEMELGEDPAQMHHGGAHLLDENNGDREVIGPCCESNDVEHNPTRMMHHQRLLEYPARQVQMERVSDLKHKKAESKCSSLMQVAVGAPDEAVGRESVIECVEAPNSQHQSTSGTLPSRIPSMLVPEGHFVV
jgi:hypothetical protein